MRDQTRRTTPMLTAAIGTLASGQSAQAGAGASDLPMRRPKTMPGDPNPVLYVGNLFFEVTEDKLRQHFQEHGNVKSVRIVYDHRGMSKG